MNIEFTNNIGTMIEEYINRTGATKTWIANQLGYKSNQALDGVIMSKNPTIKTLIIFSTFLNCKIEELYSYRILNSK